MGFPGSVEAPLPHRKMLLTQWGAPTTMSSLATPLSVMYPGSRAPAGLSRVSSHRGRCVVQLCGSMKKVSADPCSPHPVFDVVVLARAMIYNLCGSPVVATFALPISLGFPIFSPLRRFAARLYVGA